MPDPRLDHGRSAYDLALGICDGLNTSAEVFRDVQAAGVKINPNAGATAPALHHGHIDFPDSMPTKAGVPLGVLRELVKASESGEFGGYDALAWHPNYKPDAMSRPQSETGFPLWEGSAATGVRSHGAGAYQFEPMLWNEFAVPLGITDFSPASQDRVANAAIMRYGIAKWATDVKLIRAIKVWKASGKMPSNLVAPPPDLMAGKKPSPESQMASMALMGP